MSKIHPIEAELSKTLGIKRGAKESDKTFFKKLHTAATTCDDKVWADLSLAAQGWSNEYTDFVKDIRATAPTFDEIDAMAKEGKFGEAPSAGAAAKKEKALKAAAAKTEKADKKAAGKAEAKADKADKKAPAKEAAPKKAGGMKGGGQAGYLGEHRAGSTKEAVHMIYDGKHPKIKGSGGEAALKYALKEGIKEGSAKSWIASWGGFKKK